MMVHVYTSVCKLATVYTVTKPKRWKQKTCKALERTSKGFRGSVSASFFYHSPPMPVFTPPLTKQSAPKKPGVMWPVLIWSYLVLLGTPEKAGASHCTHTYFAGKVCGPVRSTWGTSLGEDKLRARARHGGGRLLSSGTRPPPPPMGAFGPLLLGGGRVQKRGDVPPVEPGYLIQR